MSEKLNPLRIHVRDDQDAKLRKESAKTGASVAEIVRRSIDKYFARASKEKQG